MAPGLPTDFAAEDPCASWQTPVACFTKDIVFAMGITTGHCYHRPSRESAAAVPSFQKDLLSYATLESGLPAASPAPCRSQAPGCSGCIHAPDLSSVATPHACTRGPGAITPRCLHSRPLFGICALGTHTSDTCASLLCGCLPAGPSARRDHLSCSIPRGEKIQKVPSSLHH